MKRRIVIRFLLSIIVFVVLIKIFAKLFIEPWIENEIQTILSEKWTDYTAEIGNVDISIIASGIRLEMISISSKQGSKRQGDLRCEIESIKLNGINLVSALFRKSIDINKLTITNSHIKGTLPFPDKTKPIMVVPSNIRIGMLLFDKTELTLKNTLNSQAYSVKKGFLKVYGIDFKKQDTSFLENIRNIDFETEEYLSVSSDSMYTINARGINYSGNSNTCVISSLDIQPNYTNYDFASTYSFEKDRFAGTFSNIHSWDFLPLEFLKSGNLICSSIEIAQMDLEVFRDKRKEFRHTIKPAFQEVIYNYAGHIDIDSISIKTGRITYTEHAEGADKPGYISFNEISAKIYKITNDTIYKTENASFELKGEALLMGKGRMSVALKAKIYDNQNTFSLKGTLSNMEVQDLNPMFEKNAFVFVTSGKIDAMSYTFSASDTKATGTLLMEYHGLDLAVKNKNTNDTTAIKERLSSIVVNYKLLNSNPLPGEKVRKGIIEYDRDPERFLFNYCFKSIFSGIKSTILKNPPAKNNK